MKTQQNIILFVIVSVVFHGVLILFFIEQDKISLAAEQGSPGLMVELYKDALNNKLAREIVARENVERGKQISPTPVKKLSTELLNHKKVISAEKSDSALVKESVSLPEAKIMPEQAVRSNEQFAEETEQVSLSVNYSEVAQIIKNELTKYFYYPSIAQRRHWQGKVLIEFTVFSNGVIDQVKIRESSGYSVLDLAALDAVRKIKQPEQLSLALNGQQIYQVLPVTYKLIN